MKSISLFLCCWFKCVRHSLDLISVDGDTHDWHARNLTDSSFEILVVRRHDIALVLCHSVHNAVVGVSSLMHAVQSLKSVVFNDLQSQFILLTHLLELTSDTSKSE